MTCSCDLLTGEPTCDTCLRKHVVKVETFDNYLLNYPLLLKLIIESFISAVQFFYNYKLDGKFQIVKGMQNDDFANDKFTLVIYYKQKAPTK